jgi:hypothetical protein
MARNWKLLNLSSPLYSHLKETDSVDECFIVHSLGLICPASQTLGLFCLHVVWGGGSCCGEPGCNCHWTENTRYFEAHNDGPILFELIRFYSNITLSNPVHCVCFSDQFCLSFHSVSSS